MRSTKVILSVFAYLILNSTVHAQSHRGQMDTDGILSPGEIPNPRIRYDEHRYDQVPQYNGGSSGCRGVSRREISRPQVEIDRVKQTGNFFDNKVKVRGSVEGSCLTEAGLFENGRKVEDIPINTINSFERYEFEVKTHLDEEPEIRVYNTLGERDIIEISGEAE